MVKAVFPILRYAVKQSARLRMRKTYDEGAVDVEYKDLVVRKFWHGSLDGIGTFVTTYLYVIISSADIIYARRNPHVILGYA